MHKRIFIQHTYTVTHKQVILQLFQSSFAHIKPVIHTQLPEYYITYWTSISIASGITQYGGLSWAHCLEVYFVREGTAQLADIQAKAVLIN